MDPGEDHIHKGSAVSIIEPVSGAASTSSPSDKVKDSAGEGGKVGSAIFRVAWDGLCGIKVVAGEDRK